MARSLRAVEFDGWLMLELSCPNGDHSAYWRRALERTRTLFAG